VQLDGVDLQRNIYLARNVKLPATRAQTEFWDFVSETKVDLQKPMVQA